VTLILPPPSHHLQTRQPQPPTTRSNPTSPSTNPPGYLCQASTQNRPTRHHQPAHISPNLQLQPAHEPLRIPASTVRATRPPALIPRIGRIPNANSQLTPSPPKHPPPVTNSAAPPAKAPSPGDPNSSTPDRNSSPQPTGSATPAPPRHGSNPTLPHALPAPAPTLAHPPTSPTSLPAASPTSDSDTATTPHTQQDRRPTHPQALTPPSTAERSNSFNSLQRDPHGPRRRKPRAAR